jgi:hypothetical protein
MNRPLSLNDPSGFFWNEFQTTMSLWAFEIMDFFNPIESENLSQEIKQETFEQPTD